MASVMPTKSPRERAARALCRLDGHPENTMFEGKPMWMSYLDQVDAVLKAALAPEEWEKIEQADEYALGQKFS
jgi:hypothetical protein